MLWLAIALVLISGCKRLDSSRRTEVGSPGNHAWTDPKETPRRTQADMSDYEPVPLDRLIGIAQLIVAGEVSNVKDQTFTLRPTLTLAGEAPSAEIEVVKFIPNRFEGAPRPGPYKPGQSFLWFLIKDPKDQLQNRWKILGIGGEGEMPLQDGFVYFHGRNVAGIPFGSYRVHEVERNIQRYEAAQLFDAVKGYRSCFVWKAGKTERPEPTRICDTAAFDQLARRSSIHKYLAGLTAKRISKDK